MTKLRLLNEFFDKEMTDALTSSEIRLYFLLLANNGEKGKSEINFSIIRSALGRKFTIKMLMSACNTLRESGLIEVIEPFPETREGGDFTLTYKILYRENIL